MPLTALVVVPPVYVGAVHAVPVWSSGVVAPVVGLGCLVIGSTNQLLLSVGAVVLLMAVADVGSSAAASHAAGPRTERFRDVAAVAGHRRFGRTAVERGESGADEAVHEFQSPAVSSATTSGDAPPRERSGGLPAPLLHPTLL